MPHAQIISTEFNYKEDLDVAIITRRKCYPDKMMTNFSENEDLLNQAKEIATQRWELYGHHVYETIVFDGPVID